MEFSYFTRLRDLEKLDGKEFDVLIVGGGIVGAGIASILSSNGVSVLLVEKGDFASGTSSNSSKLIHGGLRYLAQGHVLLTRELLKERNYLLNHLDFVKRVRFDILVDDGSWSKSSLYVGLFLYNLLGGKLSFPRFRTDGYSYRGYVGRFTYEDAATDDALLVVHNIVSAVMKGATAINYLEATSFRDKDDGVETFLKEGFGNGTFKVRSRIVVNAAGPWVNIAYGNYTSSLIGNLRLSKGSHLIFRKDKFEREDAIAFRSHLDGRQMFVIPKGEVVIVGTTDEFIDSPGDSGMSDEERDYILNSVRKIYPSLGEEDLVGSYSGIRPLYGGGDNPGRVTRDFHVDITRKMISIMGVKITNYRAASRKISKQIGKMLDRKLDVSDLPKILYSREGKDPIESAFTNECAITVEDVLKRRLGYYYTRADQGKEYVEEIERRLKAIQDTK